MELIKTHYSAQGYLDSRRGGRPENQDSCDYLDTPHGLLVVVCDGMGGGPSGKLASTIAVRETIEYVKTADIKEARDKILKDAVAHAHKVILDYQNQDPSTRGMGTTLTALLINSESAYVAHVGDSRVYQFRRGKMVFRTKDHSYVGELVQKGDLTEEQARLSARSNIITRCLGGKSQDMADIDGPLSYYKGDRFMLCTDGIWGMLPEPELIKLVAKTPSLSGATDAAVIAIDEKGRNDGNHHDNLTIALLDTTDDSELQEPMNKTARITITILSVLLALSLLFGINQCNKLKHNNEAKEQIEELENELRINKDSLNFYKGQIKGNKEKGPDVNVFLTDGNKESEKTTEKETENKTENKTESKSTANNNSIKDEVKKIINEIILELAEARDMDEINERKQIRNDIVAKLATLTRIDPGNKDKYDYVTEELQKNRATQTDELGKGQYNILINDLGDLKKSQK